MKQILFFSMLLIATACTSLQENEALTDQEKALKILTEEGYNTYKATYDETYIYLEKDIMINIQNILENAKYEEKSRSKQNMKRKHTWDGGQVSSRYRGNITISMASDMRANWLEALNIAIARYNKVNRFEIKFSYTTGGARTHVSYGNLASNVAGTGEYPNKIWSTSKLRFYRRPGTEIKINPSTTNYPLSHKIDLLMHEIGHTIGFEHTFTSASHKAEYLGNGGSFDGERISGTAEYDNSIMTPGLYTTAGNFSANDIIALQMVYPGPFVSQFNVNISGPSFAMTNQTVTYSTTTDGQTYLWEVKYAGSYSWFRVGTGKIVSFKIGTQATPNGINTMQVRCTIIKSNGDEGRGAFYTTVEGMPTDGSDPR